ncbi:MAG TPA: hypothetical protein VF416_05890 [Marmoricola sp.]
MSPLQRIAMGLVIVLVPANFPHDPHPAWAFYDALPDPIGWLLVLSGVRALSAHLDLDVARWLAWAAFAVSVPLWFPQVNHLLVPEYNDSIEVSFQWFLALPQTAFGLALARSIGRRAELQDPRDTFVAGRFGVLTWGFAALLVLPVVAYGGAVDALVNPTLVAIGVVNVAFVYYLFRVHRREWLGGPGPLEVHPSRSAGDR